MDFGRLITAMVTPFNEQFEVDYDRAKELAKYLVANGSDGLVVAGTTGESPTLTKEEKIKLFATVVEAVGDQVPIIAGTGTNDTASSIALSQEAEAVGVQGLLLVGPYYNKPSQKGYYQHFEAISKATKVPIMLYNIPGRTGSNIETNTVAELAQIDNIVAIKEAAGSMDQVSELAQKVPDSFRIYSGDDGLTLPMMALGGYGVVSVSGHIIGQEIQKMMQAFVAGRNEEATAIHKKYYRLFKGLFVATNPIGVKTALNLIGQPVGTLRLPMVPATTEEVKFLKELLKSYGLIECQCNCNCQ
ncbi:4-hydroxy-tetrahydrodipicolinate synthase [Heliorestis acidaminivorans]|uniref:4-hydroxy-tetrahydrodipicolinate synthase n=1 Tax=Heliorestis acidaminivorans TaxID=553427 RepID=A0A6I0F675_9FIRM|nr:4-hydroxy-tetrahydrodipicolinate synthase [Heliorestis acidaminivorans]KAB2954337.1 4-hydroxy-tetrahydrodipicolinate synthase [Heliorestis acidaminivorans]